MRGWTRPFTGLVAVAVVGLGVPAVSASVANAAPAAPVAPVALAALAVPGGQPVPGHTKLVPTTARANTPRISNGQITDIEVIGNRVFIAGTFTSLANTIGNTATVNQANLASYNIDTGLIDTGFRPTFNGGVAEVEASPDGTKLFVGGSFSTVSGVARQKVASLNLTTGVPVPGFNFTGATNNQVTALAATNTTVYIGGRFTKINNVNMTGLAAANAATGVVDPGFVNPITGGIGVSGVLSVQRLKLTHDNTKLLVIHTGRQIAGQDRLGIGLIDTATKLLLPWRTRLWDDNLARAGGVTRIVNGDISPDDSYFVVTSGDGGDLPPISDTAVRFPIAGADNVQPDWVARDFDSTYTVAITEVAVYIGGHFNWNESPTANQPWPGLDNVGYGTGQGLSGYGLGDQVVRRDHLGALDPATGTALEWDPGSNSFEGNKALKATSRGLFTGGDATIQGGVKTGRVAFFDFNTAPAASPIDTTITTPIEGRVIPAGQGFTITGTATSNNGVKRVQVEIQNRDSKQYLQDDLATWGGSNNVFATLATPNANSTTWSLNLPAGIVGSQNLQIMAKAFGATGSDPVKAVKKIETFSFDDQTPSTTITGPTATVLASTTFSMTGTAADDHGIDALSFWFRDENNNYLQPDGSVAPIFNTFHGTPDVIGAPNATWSYTVTVPHEGVWRGSATAIDTAGQADLRSAVRDWTINSTAVAPTVTISQPAPMTPPFAAPTVVVPPGSPITFSGTASDDTSLQNVEIYLRNNTTRENLGSDGTWGLNVGLGLHRISPVDINAPTYNWSYTTPFNLSAGTYTFAVLATDADGLTTPLSNIAQLTLLAQVPGDSPPNGLLNVTGTQALTTPHIDLAGTATDDIGVQSLKVTVFDNDTGRYLQSNGTMASDYSLLGATLASPGATSTTWTLPVDLPTSGNFSVTAYAYDTAGQQDSSTTGATATYLYYPGDLPPVFVDTLGQPVSGTAFDQGVIVVTGRANDDFSIARVEVAIVNAAGQYMSSSGTFTSTTPSWTTAFLNSPGSQGSSFSYTTPVIPDGTYSVLVRPTDSHNQIGLTKTSTGVTVTHPANNPPVAHATVACNQNVCAFDGRTSTDEDPTSLIYSWSFGTGQGSASGPVPTRTYTAPGTFTVTLTVKDEWNLTGTTTLTVPITEPAGNVAPTPTFITNCIALACGTSSTGTVDPNTGDVFSNSWNWGDGTANSTGSAASHTYALPGTYTITLTSTDGWGRAASTTRTITMTEPVTNVPPTVTFTATCTLRVCQTNSFGTSDPNGDQIRYSWNWGDGSAVSTSASPAHTYTAAGTYTITLTVTDGWNRSAFTTRTVIVA
jgi:large repetitive protein